MGRIKSGKGNNKESKLSIGLIKQLLQTAKKEERARLRELVETYRANARCHTKKDCKQLFNGCRECATAETCNHFLQLLSLE